MNKDRETNSTPKPLTVLGVMQELRFQRVIWTREVQPRISFDVQTEGDRLTDQQVHEVTSVVENLRKSGRILPRKNGNNVKTK